MVIGMTDTKTAKTVYFHNWWPSNKSLRKHDELVNLPKFARTMPHMQCSGSLQMVHCSDLIQAKLITLNVNDVRLPI